MNSGIYILVFNETYFYVGKADDIPRRWEQHRNDFAKNKHTRKLQWAYDTYGPPEYRVHCTLHSDHLDLMESIIIRHNWSDNCLNGNKPKEVPADEVEILTRCDPQLLNISTAAHIRRIRTAEELLIEATALLEEYKDEGYVLPQEEAQEKDKLRKELKFQQQQLQQLRNRGLWARIMNK